MQDTPEKVLCSEVVSQHGDERTKNKEQARYLLQPLSDQETNSPCKHEAPRPLLHFHSMVTLNSQIVRVWKENTKIMINYLRQQ